MKRTIVCSNSDKAHSENLKQGLTKFYKMAILQLMQDLKIRTTNEIAAELNEMLDRKVYPSSITKAIKEMAFEDFHLAKVGSRKSKLSNRQGAAYKLRTENVTNEELEASRIEFAASALKKIIVGLSDLAKDGNSEIIEIIKKALL